MRIKNLFSIVILISVLIFLVFYISACVNPPSGSSNPTPTATATNPPPVTNSHNYVIMVGVENYPGAINDLDYTIDDVNDLKQSLKDSARWANTTFVSITDNDATKAIIQVYFNFATGQVDAGGTFLFFFSGHGTNDGNTGYLVTYDGITAGGGTIAGNMISEGELESWLALFPASSKKIVIIDACHSGSLIGKSLPPNSKIKFLRMPASKMTFKKDFLKDINTVSNLFAMTASAGDETSIEDPALQNSVFTYYLAEGLGSGVNIGPADVDASGAIICLESFNYADPRATAINGTQHAQSYHDIDTENLTIK